MLLHQTCPATSSFLVSFLLRLHVDYCWSNQTTTRTGVTTHPWLSDSTWLKWPYISCSVLFLALAMFFFSFLFLFFFLSNYLFSPNPLHQSLPSHFQQMFLLLTTLKEAAHQTQTPFNLLNSQPHLTFTGFHVYLSSCHFHGSIVPLSVQG